MKHALVGAPSQGRQAHDIRAEIRRGGLQFALDPSEGGIVADTS
jgi:hypothetical protein